MADAKDEEAASACEGLRHRFMPGLQFDGPWRYAVGQEPEVHWQEMPLEPGLLSRASSGDPEGAWWCVRRCVAVLGRQTWRTVHPPQRLSARPPMEEVGEVLQRLLPQWALRVEEGAIRDLMGTASLALERGGCALVRLALHRGRQPAGCWAWVVGTEVRAHLRSMLVVGPRWSVPWGCGYGARVMVDGQGGYQLRGTDGQYLQGTGMEMLTLMQAPPA